MPVEGSAGDHPSHALLTHNNNTTRHHASSNIHTSLRMSLIMICHTTSMSTSMTINQMMINSKLDECRSCCWAVIMSNNSFMISKRWVWVGQEDGRCV